MWSISQPRKGPLHCSCHLSAKGEALERIFLELLLAAHSRPQPKPTFKNHCKEWIQLFLSAWISHDPDPPQGPAVVESDTVNLGQWAAQQCPGTNTMTWLVISRGSRVPQSSNCDFLGKWRVGRHSRGLCISQAKTLRAESCCVHPSGLRAQPQPPWKDARSGSYGSAVPTFQRLYPIVHKQAASLCACHSFSFLNGRDLLCLRFCLALGPTFSHGITPHPWVDTAHSAVTAERAGKISPVGSLVLKAVSYKILYLPSLSVEWKNWTVIHAPFLSVLKVLNQK